MATYHRVGCFPPRGPGVYIHEIMVSFDADPAVAVAASEGVGYHNHGGMFSARSALKGFSHWFADPEMAWLKPWLETLAQGDAVATRGVLAEYRERYGTDPETLEW